MANAAGRRPNVATAGSTARMNSLPSPGASSWYHAAAAATSASASGSISTFIGAVRFPVTPLQPDAPDWGRPGALSSGRPASFSAQPIAGAVPLLPLLHPTGLPPVAAFRRKAASSLLTANRYPCGFLSNRRSFARRAGDVLDQVFNRNALRLSHA